MEIVLKDGRRSVCQTLSTLPFNTVFFSGKWKLTWHNARNNLKSFLSLDDLFLFQDGWGAGSAPAGGGEAKSGAWPNHLGEGAGCTIRSSLVGGEGWTRGKVSGMFY